MSGCPTCFTRWSPPMSQARSSISCWTVSASCNGCGRNSDPGVPLVARGIFPIPALALPDPREVAHRFDPHDIFGLFVAELAFDPEAQRRTMTDRQHLVVHPPAEVGLGMIGVDHIDRLVIGLVAEIIRAVKHDIAGRATYPGAVEQQLERHARPFADRAPPLDA